jgi:5-methylcytosine-specific restriction endonuclease McrA
MKAINAIVPRGLQVLLIMAILALLVKFFAPENFFYPSIAIAALLAIVAIFFIYRASGAVSSSEDGSESKKKKLKKSGDGEASKDAPEADISSSEDAVLPEPGNFRTRFKSPGDKPSAFDVADKYYKMAAVAKAEEEERNTWKPKPGIVDTKTVEAKTAEPEPGETPAAEMAEDGADSKEEVSPKTVEAAVDENKTETVSETGESPLTLISDETSLTDEEKSELENAVWYRCENPYCKYTHFLDVHHIIDEKNGGTNKLDNLIVLCPYCHDLAHKNEIPENEMRLWISNREERFKFKVHWHYF